MKLNFLDQNNMEGVKSHWIDWSKQRQNMVKQLISNGQIHIFENWELKGLSDIKKENLLCILEKVNQSYPGGICSYIDNGRKLFKESQLGKNPFEGFIPEQPDKVDLTKIDNFYSQMEKIGVQQFAEMGLVLVAGGLGERLGFDGIKIDITLETIQDTTYIKYFADNILAIERRANIQCSIPFIVMVSENTELKTRSSFVDNNYYGLKSSQVFFLKQELVPAFTNSQGKLALNGKYELIMKPHGHGDIHILLHQSGLAKKLKSDGINYLVFIQDTNGQVFNAVPAALGAAFDNNFDFLSLAVNRIPGEAVGGLAKLVKNKRYLTLNVEYNQLEPLLRDTVNPEGDIPNEEGFSIFPGNINVLVVNINSYVEILEQTKGVIAEFVNPKYEDTNRSIFKKPARLETMMQDLPKLYTSEQKVGVAVFDRIWSFSANKNKLDDALIKQKSGRPAESASTAEADFYEAGRMKLRYAGMHVEDAKSITVNGISFIPGPRVILSSNFAITLEEVKNRISGGFIGDEATLSLNGSDIKLDQVELKSNAALLISAVSGASVYVRGRFDNRGFERILLSKREMVDNNIPETVRMRGYRMVDRGALIYKFDKPGSYLIEGD